MTVEHVGFVGEHMRRARSMIPRQQTVSVGVRERPGFGCPSCGASLDRSSDKNLILGVTGCCGSALEGKTAARVLAARRLAKS